MTNKSEDETIGRVNQMLDEKPAELDEGIVDRLALARRRALDAIPVQKSRSTAGYYFGGAVTASLLAMLVYFNMPSQEQHDEYFSVSDFEVLIETNEELEMLDNDPDFYLWLEEQTNDS